MRRINSRVVGFLADKPLSVLTAMFSLRDLLLALSFIVAAPDATQTLLYQNIAYMIPPALFGIVFGVICLITGVGALTNRIKWARLGLDLQALLWLFAGCVYFLAGAPWLALVFGLLFSLSSGYISHCFKNPQRR